MTIRDLDCNSLCPKHQKPFWDGTEICPICRKEFLDACTEGVPDELKEWLMQPGSVGL